MFETGEWTIVSIYMYASGTPKHEIKTESLLNKLGISHKYYT